MPRHARALLDTSVLIHFDQLTENDLPEYLAIASITLAELAAGPHAARDSAERARRQFRLQWAEATFHSLPFDADAARAYGPIYATAEALGRKARGRRAVDLLIAATALAAQLPLYTCDPSDFASLSDLVEIVAVPRSL